MDILTFILLFRDSDFGENNIPISLWVSIPLVILFFIYMFDKINREEKEKKERERKDKMKKEQDSTKNQVD